MRALIPAADGSEEMELVIMADVLRRAGFEVRIASVESDLHLTASRQVKLIADDFITPSIPGAWDAVLLPGGMPGAERLSTHSPLIEFLRDYRASGGLLGAICAAPAVVLGRNGLLEEQERATCHPAFQNELSGFCTVDATAPVIECEDLVTSQGPGTAMAFALQIVANLKGVEAARAVAAPMIFSITA